MLSSKIAEKMMLDISLNGESWECTLISENAESNIEEGIIVASYNAG